MKVFRVIDTETTGLDGPPKGGIMELAWTDVVVVGNIVEYIHPVVHLCNPDLPCNVEALAVHHITPEKIEGKPHADTYMDALNEGADCLVAHNMGFDEKFLKTSLPKICTFKSALVAFPDSPSHKNQVLRYWLNLGLKEEDCNPPHAAGPDTWVTAHIFGRLLAQLTPEQMVVISAEPARLPRCPIGKFRGKPWSEVDIGFLAWMVNQPTMEPDLKWNAKREIQRRRDSGL